MKYLDHNLGQAQKMASLITGSKGDPSVSNQRQHDADLVNGASTKGAIFNINVQPGAIINIGK